ncbi:MAG: hypothetical protein JJU00_07215 [Opitutales bacterium]|nr:hypothetical protein [Opitutales bacterium]
MPSNVGRGNVYLLDEQRGMILQVGRFSDNEGEVILSLRVPNHQLREEVRWQAQFWHPGYSSYSPYVDFINDVRLRNSISEIVSTAFRDSALREEAEELGRKVFEELFAKAQPSFREITDDPQFRSLLVDVALEEGSHLLPRAEHRRIERTWVGPMVDVVVAKARLWPWSEWVGEIVSDPEKEETLNSLLNSMEPYFREALQDFLWNRDQILRPGPQYAPNVRLLWVARRTLFGARESAITLLEATDGEKLSGETTLTVQEIQ